MKTRFLIPIFLLLFIQSVSAQEEVYELRTYELEVFRPAEVLHTYFEKALLPALNRQGIENIGVYEEASDNLPKKIFRWGYVRYHLTVPSLLNRNNASNSVQLSPG